MENDPSKGTNGAIAAELRAERSAVRISFDALAERTGISKRTLLRIFNGQRAATMNYLETICDEMGVPMSVVMRRAEKRLASQLDEWTLAASEHAYDPEDQLMGESD